MRVAQGQCEKAISELRHKRQVDKALERKGRRRTSSKAEPPREASPVDATRISAEQTRRGGADEGGHRASSRGKRENLSEGGEERPGLGPWLAHIVTRSNHH